MEQSPPITIAAAPFDGSFANIILRSSDNVDFYVYKEILIMTSQVFRDIFNIPPPPIPDRRDLHREAGLSVIPVLETSAILDPLLRLCTPLTAEPTFASAELIGDVIAAAAKYDMGDVLRGKLKDRLRDLAHTEPIKVYAVACYHGFDDIATLAAESSRSLRRISYDPLFDRISAGSLFRLLEKRSVREPPMIIPRNRKAPRFTEESVTLASLPPSLEPIVMPGLDNVHPSDIIIISCRDGPENRIHIYHLVISSPVMAAMLPQYNGNYSGAEIAGHHRHLVLPEDAVTVAALLQCCRPNGAAPVVADLLEAGRFLAAARKYEIARALSCAENAWLRHVTAQPRQAYFIAMQNGWELEAIEPARQLLFLPELAYVPEMETASAKAYCRLLDFKQRFLKHWLGAEYPTSKEWTRLDFIPGALNADDLFRYLVAVEQPRGPCLYEASTYTPEDYCSSRDMTRLPWATSLGKTLLKAVTSVHF